jgi:hypothetical protein
MKGWFSKLDSYKKEKDIRQVDRTIYRSYYCERNTILESIYDAFLQLISPITIYIGTMRLKNF